MKEDQLISFLISEEESKGKKIKWAEISQNLKQKNINWKRTGKQCRQRWLNHLRPTLGRQEREQQIDLQVLFRLIRTHGKKWTVIAKEMPSKTDNSIKNFFYASLRKGLRNLNFYNTEIRFQRRYKCYQQQLIDKILSVHDEKKNRDLLITDNSVFCLADKIRESLIKSYKDDFKSNSKICESSSLVYEQLSDDILQFCRLCKFKKSKASKSKLENQKFEVFQRKQQRKVFDTEESIIQEKSISTELKNIKVQQQNFSEIFMQQMMEENDNVIVENEDKVEDKICDIFEEGYQAQMKENEMCLLKDDEIENKDRNLFESLSLSLYQTEDLFSVIF